mgnify:CR=1 FL=1
MNIENEISKDLGLEIVRLEVSEEDRQVEGALRPKTLEEFVGQHRVREQLDLILRADRKSTRLNSSHMSESRMPSSA